MYKNGGTKYYRKDTKKVNETEKAIAGSATGTLTRTMDDDEIKNTRKALHEKQSRRGATLLIKGSGDRVSVQHKKQYDARSGACCFKGME